MIRQYFIGNIYSHTKRTPPRILSPNPIFPLINKPNTHYSLFLPKITLETITNTQKRTVSSKERNNRSSEITAMAGLFDKQADFYLNARPDYPKQWYKWLADRTNGHSLAWDAGTGNGQAAIEVAEHYEQVIATDVSQSQLQRAVHHPRVKYQHTPLSVSEDDMVKLLGGENSVDLITVAQAVHWFDLPSFYSIARRVLRKSGGVIAVWCYNDVVVSPEFDQIMKRFHDTTLPYWHPNIQHVFEGYRNLSFPFDGVGLGSEGEPLALDIPKKLSFDGFLGMLRSWSAVTTASEKGVDLLHDEIIQELESAWGGSKSIRPVVYKAFMLAGKLRV